MKLKDILTKENYNKYGDMDVIDNDGNYFDAWCGNTLTPVAKRMFGNALALEANIVPQGKGYWVIAVNFDINEDHYTIRRYHNETEVLFSSMCGYCTPEQYDAWFID